MATASMANRRQALAALAAERGGSQGATGRLWKRVALAVAILALLAFVAMWLLGFFSTPREIAEIRRLVDEQVVQLETAARTGTPPDQVAGYQNMRDTMRAVPRQYREQAGREFGRFFAARDQAEMDSYFALPPERRQAELDRRIKADEDRRKAWESERARREQQRRDAAGGNANASGPGPTGTPSGRRGGGTEESRNLWGKRQIDRTTPEQRAQKAEYRRAVEERRIQLGLGPSRRS
ncbi:MAG: hypothetical protein K8S94_04060 [Planctomycetia bacterium]|nr:hypothetical protein [Planctomycetia bacterium]